MNRLEKVKLWISATRPYSFPASLAPVILGLSYSYQQMHTLNYLVALLTIMAALFLQVAANLYNDYFDGINKIDSEARMGFHRLSSFPEISPVHVLWAGHLAAGVALLAGLYLILIGGLPIMIIGLLCLAFSYLYTAGPFPLAYHGLGEIAVVVFFGLIPVAGSYYLQTFHITSEIILKGFAPGMISAAIMAINNYRDRQTDIAAGKRTIANRLPKLMAGLFPIALVLLGLLLSFHWINILLALLYLPVGKEILIPKNSEDHNLALKHTGQFLLVFALIHAFLAIY